MGELIHGFGTFTATGWTGPILVDFHYKAQRGTVKHLLGNPGTGAYADTRQTTPTFETMTVHFAFEVSPSMSALDALVGTKFTVSIPSDNTTPATVTMTDGIIQSHEYGGKVDDWHMETLELKKV